MPRRPSTAGLVDLGYRRLVRPAVFAAGDAEDAHERALRMLTGIGRVGPARTALGAVLGRHRTPVRVAGIDFPGVLGLAAGMDKDGRAVRAWGSLGFGFAELGTVTAAAQPGNPRPRLVRLPSSSAVINWMGFNNAGATALADTLRRIGVARGNRAAGIPLGISIGKTKITPLEQAVPDYLDSYRALAGYADYLAVNVSSPNTPGLRSLQDAAALAELISTLTSAAREDATGGLPPLPIMVKVAPDLTDGALEQVIGVCEDSGAAGLIATNTTVSRDGIAAGDLDLAPSTGGLSGAPLAGRARQVVGFLAERSRLPVIGVGGIATADDARALLDSGAALLQLLTGFIYSGPALIDRINRAHQTMPDRPTAPR